MASNSFAKSVKGFVVYDIKGELDLKKILELENFEHLRYRIANENEFGSIGFLPTQPLEVNEDGEVLVEEEFVTEVGNFVCIKIGQSKKKIPASAVKRKVKELITKAKEEAKDRGEEFELTKDLKDFYKDQATRLLLPSCKDFVDEFETHLFFDKGTERLYVLIPNYTKAESLTAFLRVHLGSVPSVVVETEHPVKDSLTKFVTSQLNDKLILKSYVKLEGDLGNVVWDKESVYDTAAKDLINKDNFSVTKLALNYDGAVDFLLDEELCFSGLKFEKSFFQAGDTFSSELLDVAGELNKIVREVLKEINK